MDSVHQGRVKGLMVVLLLNVLGLFCMTGFVYAAQATLAWDQPSTNEDGTPLQDLAGYKIHYGTTSKTYTQTVDVGNTTSHVLSNLLDGVTYYFAVTAYNSVGNESVFSSEVSKAFPKQYSLVVNRTGTGTVTSSPAGISCGSSCSGTYNSGTTVVLTATPVAGWVFSGWSGACAGSASTCQITMDSDKSVGAVFYSVAAPTVTTSPASAIADTGATLNGTVDPNNGTTSVWFEYGKTTGYGNSTTQKDAGSGDSSMPIVEGTGGLAPGTLYHYRIVAQNSVGKSNGNDMTFTTSVPPVTHQLSVSVVGKGAVTSLPAGINCGPDCGEAYSDGVPVTLTAVPEAGWNFVRWNGACSGSGSCTITMNGSASVEATFTSPEKIGIFSGGMWYLDANGNSQWDGKTVDAIVSFGTGLTGARPVAGDLNNDGLIEIGIYLDGYWYLDMNGNWKWDGEPTDTLGVFGAGLKGGVPVTGDWNGDGKTDIGVYLDGYWYLDMNGNWQWDGEPTDTMGVFGVGLVGAVPVVGDWNGDGTSEIGVYQDGYWYLDVNRSWQWDGESTDTLGIFGIGLTGEVPVAGDWNGDGTTEIGIYRDGYWYLDVDRSWQWDSEPTDTLGIFGAGLTGEIPMAGKW